jgi:hypothetical protein
MVSALDLRGDLDTLADLARVIECLPVGQIARQAGRALRQASTTVLPRSSHAENCEYAAVRHELGYQGRTFAAKSRR